MRIFIKGNIFFVGMPPAIFKKTQTSKSYKKLGADTIGSLWPQIESYINDQGGKKRLKINKKANLSSNMPGQVIQTTYIFDLPQTASEIYLTRRDNSLQVGVYSALGWRQATQIRRPICQLIELNK